MLYGDKGANGTRTVITIFIAVRTLAAQANRQGKHGYEPGKENFFVNNRPERPYKTLQKSR